MVPLHSKMCATNILFWPCNASHIQILLEYLTKYLPNIAAALRISLVFNIFFPPEETDLARTGNFLTYHPSNFTRCCQQHPDFSQNCSGQKMRPVPSHFWSASSLIEFTLSSSHLSTTWNITCPVCAVPVSATRPHCLCSSCEVQVVREHRGATIDLMCNS